MSYTNFTINKHSLDRCKPSALYNFDLSGWMSGCPIAQPLSWLLSPAPCARAWRDSLPSAMHLSAGSSGLVFRPNRCESCFWPASPMGYCSKSFDFICSIFNHFAFRVHHSSRWMPRFPGPRSGRQLQAKIGHPRPFCSALGPKDNWISVLFKRNKRDLGSTLDSKHVTYIAWYSQYNVVCNICPLLPIVLLIHFNKQCPFSLVNQKLHVQALLFFLY